jgi:hypothetical protein
MNLLRDLLPNVTDLPPVNGVAVFVIGEQLNANKTSNERYACTGTFMHAVCTLAGIDDYMVYLRATSMRRNLFRPGQLMLKSTMCKNAELMLKHFEAYGAFYGKDVRARQVLLCGAWARDAFNFTGDCGRQSSDPANAVTWVPHPSGRNRFYNDPKNRDAVRKLLGLVFAHVL